MDTADHDGMRFSGAGDAASSRMRTIVQLVGSVVLGLGLGASIGLDPGLIFAAYVIGLGLTLLCLGLLLPEGPGGPEDRQDRSLRRHP